MLEIIAGFLLLPVFFRSSRPIRVLAGIVYLFSAKWLDWNITPRGNVELVACMIFTVCGIFLIGFAVDKNWRY